MCEQDREDAIGTIKVGVVIGALVMFIITISPPILSRELNINDLWHPSSIEAIEGNTE
tara:strand:- start:303 stop:476 length:174 start_codon:yes stop_codon:yes gene_type:complete